MAKLAMPASISRRDTLRLGLGGAAMLAAGPAFAQGKTLKAAWYGGKDTHDRMRKAIDLFTQRNSGLAVNVEMAPFAEFYDRLPVQYAGGGAPDVHRHSMTYLFEYIERGLLADLSPYIGKSIDVSLLYPGVVDIGRSGNTVAAIGNNQIALGLFYDEKKMSASGGEKLLDNLTWENFRELASRLGKAGGDQHYGVNDNGGQLPVLELFLTQRGKSLYTADGKLAFDQQDLTEWLTYWQAMRDEQGAPPPAVTAESVGFQNTPVVKGRAAMQIGWHQQLVFLQNLMPATLQIHACPSPAGARDNGHMVRALDFWVCPAQSKQVGEAARLIDFLLNDEAALAILGLSLGGPASDRAADILAVTADPIDTKILKYIKDLRPKASRQVVRWAKGHGQLQDLLERLNAQVGFKQVTAEAAAGQFFTNARRALR